MYHKLLLLYLVAVYVLLSECIIVNKTTPCTTIKLLRGRVKYRQKGKLAKFHCNTGYILAGERYSSCIKGTWDAKIPMCVKPSCGKVKPPLNGLIYPQYQGAVLNFFCKSGYVLRGNQVTYCDGFRWSNNLPTCVATGAEPPMSCDFESEDICGWQHDLNHDFDWRRYNFQTPSGHIGTGPRADHTKGEGKDGYYMYIESSSRIENDTARLISPVYNKMEDGLCFTFYYHMYGSGIGSLRVFVKRASDSYDTKYLKAEFVESGNQGDVWKRGVVSVASVDEPFQIIIEGIRGKSYVSDIAIDDVNLTDFVCEEDEFSTISTTEESTEIVPIVESCVNRCENSSDTIYTDSFVLACDCVESCIENNSCCPDYVAVCVLGSVTDFTESYDTTRDNGYDRTEQYTVMVRATTDTTTRRTFTNTSEPPVTTTTIRPTTTEATTKWNGSDTRVWWMETATTSRPTPLVVLKPPGNSTAKPNATSTTAIPTSLIPSITTVKPVVTNVTRRWFNATRIPKSSTPTAKPRIPYRPLPTRTANTTTTNNTNTTGNSTNFNTNTSGNSTNFNTNTSGNSTNLNTNTAGNSTNLKTNTTRSSTNLNNKPRGNSTNTNTTGNTTNLKTNTTGNTTNTASNATNLQPNFPKNTTATSLKPKIEISTTIKPKISTKNNTKSSYNDVIKPELVPTQDVAASPQPPPRAPAPVVPTEQAGELPATLEMETDYIDTNSEGPIEFAKTAPIIEDKATANTHLIMGVLCGVVFVMLVALSVVLVGRRYNWRMCRRFHFQTVRHSDSMSDVRFLASDEVLDFTWRSAHN